MLRNEEIKCSFEEIPFRQTLTFEYLIKEIREIGKDAAHPLHDSAKGIIGDLKVVPQLEGPVTDPAILEENSDFVNRLMSFVLNPSRTAIDLSAAAAPFVHKPFYVTELFKTTFTGEHKKLQMAKGTEDDKMLIAIIYQAYMVVLNKFFSFDIKIDVPFIFKLTDEREHTVKYYKLHVNSNYTEIIVHGKLNKLTDQEIREMFDRSYDLDYWNEKIPLKQFEFKGFLQFSYTDITQEFVISQLKSDLLDKNSILTQDGFSRIREKVRAMLEIPDLEFGFAAATDFSSGMNRNLIWKTIIPRSELNCESYMGTFYETAYREKRIVLTDDLKQVPRDVVVDRLLDKGLRSHAIIPLIIDDELVGMIEFGSSTPGWLSLIQIKRFHELFPVFALALKRSKEEWNDRIRAVIQEKFTAIHPTVAWKFREAASSILDEEGESDSTGLDSIIFNDVHPVYGATDIRNSSLERNKAIQADLSEHLSLVKGVLIKCMHDKEMPLLNNLAYKIEKHMHTVTAGLKAGDEVSILDFLKKEIDPVFLQLKKRDSELAPLIEGYLNQMDAQTGVLYRKRKDFEDSLTRINEEISIILEREQVKAQLVFPHYFEKYRTDGVEYNAYIGQSLVENLQYDEIYLKNIRLWQLITMVRIARSIRRLRPELKTKLEVTQLILVQSSPLSIAFRQDEKKFDVAGAYNIRYEITKKRIDKAVVKGTRERITATDKIAIIYSLADEIDEYRSYVNYMIDEGYLKDKIEYLELEDLQGASGLRAIRVEVNYGSSSSIDDVDLSEINNILKNN